MSHRRFSRWWVGAAIAVAVVGIAVLSGGSWTSGRAGLASSPAPGQGQSPPTHRGPVETENHKPGTTTWQSPELARGRGEPIQEENGAQAHQRVHGSNGAGGSGSGGQAGGPSAPTITGGGALTCSSNCGAWTDTALRGYAGQSSVNHGQALDLHVGTTLPGYHVEVYRMGWYGGAGATLVVTSPTLAGQNPAIPAADPNTRLVDLNWPVSYTLQTQSSWTSGYYLAKLVGSDGSAAYVPFVVRADEQQSDVLFVVAFNTYQAYNNWGGYSLYDYNSFNNAPAYKVSYNRPYNTWSGASQLFDGDYNMIRWLEKNGYNVTYATSVDLQTTPNLLNGHKVFLSDFHDEYWSMPMRTALTAGRDHGVGITFFDANAIYWQIRFESSPSTGQADRVVVCYKDATVDPNPTGNPQLTTVNFRDPPVNLPENAVLGSMFESYFQYGTAFDWVVQNPTNWVYSGTGLTNGAHISGLVGYEYDRLWNNGLTPAGTVNLSTSPVTDFSGVKSVQQAALYRASSGAWVFDAGTIYWPWKLDDNDYQSHGADPRVQQMTANLLYAMITGILPSGGTPTPTPSPAPESYTIYGDSLTAGWNNSSWNATVNLSNTNPVYSGSSSIAFTNTAGYGALYLTTSAPFDVTPYTALQFAARATQAGQRYNLNFVNSSGQEIGNDVLLDNYGGTPPVGSWRVYTIPLDVNNFNVAGQQIGGFFLQDYTGAVQPALYVDVLGFTTASTVTPTPTPSPTATASSTPTPSPTGSEVVYHDSLMTAWSDRSVSATVDYSVMNPVYAGADAIAVQITKAGGVWQVQRSTALSTASYTTLTFAARATAANTAYTVYFVDQKNKRVGLQVQLQSYGGAPPVGSWRLYQIPISAFGAGGTSISGLAIQGPAGSTILYLDEVSFTP